MSKLTNTEAALPKTGHVTEVCKEWLVREDGALAYKLQSQERNRFRNAVVREDFPTALQEQIKEKENAEKQADAYRKYLSEQEQHDKMMAKEIADKLERDLLEQQQREFEDSELIAQQMQEIYVNLPAPPPTIREKRPPPPRPEKASFLSSTNDVGNKSKHSQKRHAHSQNHHHHHHHNHDHKQQHQQQQQQQQLLNIPGGESVRQKPLNSVALNQFVERPKNGRTPPALTNDNLSSFSPSTTVLPSTSSSPSSSLSQHHPNSRNRHDLGAAAASSSSSSSPSQHNHHHHHHHHHHHNNHNQKISRNPQTQPEAGTNPELVEYTDVTDSIRQYDILHDSSEQQQSPNHNNNSSKLHSTPSNENLLRADLKFQKLSPEKYDQMVGNGSVGRITEKERRMQQHADDIELYVDPCDYESLQEIGLPMDEIKEMSKKLKQEQKDELLARRLQEMEQNDGLTQEERDRLLAIEAQDKELAKMLQEREKAKAKRAKEKARLRKNQYQKESTSSGGGGGGLVHCGAGPIQSLPQDCLPSTSNSRYSGGVLMEEDDSMDLEPYSNPIDMITNQRLYGGGGGGGSGGGTMSSGTSSLSRDIPQNGHRSNFHLNGIDDANGGRGDDDIYTLPVDSCRPTINRPASLNIAPETTVSHHNSMTRSENFTSESHDMLSKLDVSPRMNHSKSGSFDQNCSPTPPYMPIQGTRRSNSSEERKKKTRDKCTHQ